jgi:hypothetical protein
VRITRRPRLRNSASWAHSSTTSGTGGRGRGGAGHIGDEVEQRHIGLVPDRADDRCAGRRHGSQQGLVRKWQQIFQAAPTPGDHDDLYDRILVEPPERGDDLCY